MSLLYCDQCADKFGYKIQEKKESKGECGLCHMRLGPMNNMSDDDFDHIVNSINPEIFEAGGFKARQLKGFPVGLKVQEIEPTLPHKIVGNQTVMFFASERVIFANTQTGKKFEIRF